VSNLFKISSIDDDDDEEEEEEEECVEYEDEFEVEELGVVSFKKLIENDKILSMNISVTLKDLQIFTLLCPFCNSLLKIDARRSLMEFSLRLCFIEISLIVSLCFRENISLSSSSFVHIFL
jgi:hypothetical protein